MLNSALPKVTTYSAVTPYEAAAAATITYSALAKTYENGLLPKVSTSSARGQRASRSTRDARWGLRGVRVGEATHPGPEDFRLSGFRTQALNSNYTTRQDEQVGGKPTHWDASGTYFLYFQHDEQRS